MNLNGTLKSISETFKSESMKLLRMSIYIIKHRHLVIHRFLWCWRPTFWRLFNGARQGGSILISFQLVCPCVVGLFGFSFSFKLCHVGVSLFNGGSYLYRICVPQLFSPTHAPNIGPLAYCPLANPSLDGITKNITP